MKKQEKLFAFKLAQKQAEPAKQQKWSAREGLAAAGCTDPTGNYNVRYSSSRGIDAGVYC